MPKEQPHAFVGCILGKRHMYWLLKNAYNLVGFGGICVTQRNFLEPSYNKIITPETNLEASEK
jgi:hypothetical protein